jgi:hypothetical protein
MGHVSRRTPFNTPTRKRFTIYIHTPVTRTHMWSVYIYTYIYTARNSLGAPRRNELHAPRRTAKAPRGRRSGPKEQRISATYPRLPRRSYVNRQSVKLGKQTINRLYARTCTRNTSILHPGRWTGAPSKIHCRIPAQSLSNPKV